MHFKIYWWNGQSYCVFESGSIDPSLLAGFVLSCTCTRHFFSNTAFSHIQVPQLTSIGRMAQLSFSPWVSGSDFNSLSLLVYILWQITQENLVLNQDVILEHFNPWEWLVTNSSVSITPKQTHWGFRDKGNDHQLKKLLIVKQILLVSTIKMYREQCGGNAYWCYGVKG